MPSNLFSAGQIGTMTLPNRVIRSATQDPFGHRDGTCAPEQVALYRDIAAAGTGAIITAYSYISPEARSTGIQVGFATEEQRASQKEVLDAVHEAGGRLILQLMHAGMNVFMPEKHVAGGKLLAPTGGLKAPNDMETTEITAEDMAKIKADFVDAAKAAKELGFDGIQLHCAHGYLLSQFRTPTPTSAPMPTAAAPRTASASPANVSPPSVKQSARTTPSSSRSTPTAAASTRPPTPRTSSTSAVSSRPWVPTPLSCPATTGWAWARSRCPPSTWTRPRPSARRSRFPSSWSAACAVRRRSRPSWTPASSLSPPPALSSASLTL